MPEAEKQAQRVRLGDVYRDRLFGIEGLATRRTEYLGQPVAITLLRNDHGILVHDYFIEEQLDFVREGPDLSKPCVEKVESPE